MHPLLDWFFLYCCFIVLYLVMKFFLIVVSCFFFFSRSLCLSASVGARDDPSESWHCTWWQSFGWRSEVTVLLEPPERRARRQHHLLRERKREMGGGERNGVHLVECGLDKNTYRPKFVRFILAFCGFLSMSVSFKVILFHSKYNDDSSRTTQIFVQSHAL